MRRAWIMLVALAAILTCRVRLAQAQEAPTLGGHIGFVLPLVTDTSVNTASLADAPAVGFPMGITIVGGGRAAFDLEFAPQYNATGKRLTTLTVHPGILWGFGKTWAVGLRAAFDVSQPSTGFTPLLHKNFPITNQHGPLKAYFVEADLPVRFNRPFKPACDERCHTRYALWSRFLKCWGHGCFRAGSTFHNPFRSSSKCSYSREISPPDLRSL